MYLIIGKHSLLLQHGQDFPSLLAESTDNVPPPSPQISLGINLKNTISAGLSAGSQAVLKCPSSLRGACIPGFSLQSQRPGLWLAPNQEATAPSPAPECLACPQVFAQHDFLWLAVFSLAEMSEVPERAELSHLGGGANMGTHLRPGDPSTPAFL